jgi:hypothetical protein
MIAAHILSNTLPLGGVVACAITTKTITKKG